MARRRILVEWLAVALVASAVVAWFARDRIAERLDHAVYDGLLSLDRRPPPDDIVIVAIDTPSLAAVGRWPWPRGIHTDLVRRIAARRPKAIGYDVLFVEPDSDPAVDTALAAAIAKAGNVFLPVLIDVPGPNGAPYRLAPPIAPVAAAAAGIGHVDLDFDRDGLVRRGILLERAGSGLRMPHLVERIYRAVARHASPSFAAAAAAPRAGGLVHDRQVLIPYAGPPGHYRTISASAVLRGVLPDGLLDDRIVLVGATAPGLGDAYPTPRADTTGVRPGIDLQANLLDMLLRDRAIRPASAGLAIGFALLPVWLLLAGFLRLGPRGNVRLGLALIAGTVGVSAAALLIGRLWLPPGAPVLVLIAAYPLWAWRRLEIVDAYMARELARLNAEPALLPIAPARARRGDIVSERVALLETATDRVRGLRRFVSDMLHGLPDATLAVDGGGAIFLSNEAADRLSLLLHGAAAGGMAEDAFLAGFGAGEDGRLTLPDGRSFDLRRVPLIAPGGGQSGHITRLGDVTAIVAAANQREAVLQLLTHDMRSPQASILAVLETAGDTVPAELQRRVGTLARRTLALADDFVQLARAEQAELAMEELDLAALLVETADDLWPQASPRGIVIAVADGDAEHLVSGDRSLLARALCNLVGNAVKYSGDNTRIDCTVRSGAGGVRCTIADQGRGMSPDQVAQLFKPFRRLGAAGSRDPGGAGLALSFVRTVIVRHGGTIACESAVDRGTTFTITLPAE